LVVPATTPSVPVLSPSPPQAVPSYRNHAQDRDWGPFLEGSGRSARRTACGPGTNPLLGMADVVRQSRAGTRVAPSPPARQTRRVLCRDLEGFWPSRRVDAFDGLCPGSHHA